MNLHWSTSNTNSMINISEKQHQSVVISKDAKAIILSDTSPVQHPGHSWKPREVADHTWDQSTTNAITPMTFLFLKSQISQTVSVDGDCIKHVTRTGKGITLVYLPFFEPDITFKCMNEIFLLLTVPALDEFFRDAVTGELKKVFLFVVNNGPQERPQNYLVQKCMVRILKLLKLDKITQVSFIEYHSKRNFVERVHAKENRLLFSSGVHAQSEVGSNEHRQNIEAMAAEVAETLRTATFGTQSLMCERGICFLERRKKSSF